MNIKRRLWIGPLVLVLVLFAVFAACGKSTSPEPGEGEMQAPIRMELTYGYGENAKGGRYIPLEVELVNTQAQEFQGSIRILTMESDYDIYRYDFPVTVPADGGEKKQMYFPIGNRADQMFVELADQDGKQVLHKRVRLNFSLDVPELFIGVLSDTPDRLKAWDGIGVDYGMLRTKTVEFSTDTFPEDTIGLDMIDVLLISNYRIRDLSERQSQALVEWVRGGGTMILGTGMRADDTLGRFAPELLEESYDPPQVGNVYMGADYAKENPMDAVLKLPCVDFALSGGNVILANEERTLLASVVYSKGTIAVAAYDFTDLDLFCQENPSYLDNVLTEVLGNNKINRLAESVYSGNSSQYWAVRNMINTGNVTKLPNLGLYVLEAAIYIFLVGIGLYIFLRQRELTELYRAGVIVLSVVFTLLFYMMGSKTRFRDSFYTYARFLETSESAVSETTYMNIRAPYNKLYTSYFTEDYSVKPITRSFFLDSGVLPAFTGAEEYCIAIEHQPDQTAISIQNIPAFEPRYFQLSKVEDNREYIGFYGNIEVDRNGIQGEITSYFKEKMENCVVLMYDKLAYLGDMEPGETKSLSDISVLEYPINHIRQIASFISGENAFTGTDIRNQEYVAAVEKTNLLEFYLDNFMPAYTPNAKVVGIQAGGDGERTFLKAATARGYTVASSVVAVYPSEDEVLYRPAVVKRPVVLGGNYDESTNSIYGVDPVTLEYSLGNDVRIEKLLFNYVSEEFINQGDGNSMVSFTGNIYFYNHNSGNFDMKDPLKLEYEAHELAPYLSPGNGIIIRYVYKDMTEYNWDVLLPMLNIVGRSQDVKD
ncbi:MAG: hypothetical protein HFG66_09750 [Hungatella sp.]|nr:hypothetical protein [Hungatella sp.]